MSKKIELIKNRNRSSYSFANINFLGKCNLDCSFCLGKDLEEEFNKYNQLKTHYLRFKNLKKFLEILKSNNIKQIYLTGQNTDPLLYEYLEEFITFLRNLGFYVGIRTNGLLAKAKINIINSCNTCKGDAVAYTLLTLDVKDMKKMTRISKIPNWDWIFRNTNVPYRVSIVVTDINEKYIFPLIRFISTYRLINNNLKYCQLRRVSTDYRTEQMSSNIRAFDRVAKNIKERFNQIKEYEKSEVFNISGLETTLWRTVSTTANSMNYFTNGVISEEYFIIEGYEKNK